MHTWQWITWEELPYLKCSLLENWPHGFFTQTFWPRPPLELTQVLQLKAEVHRVKQVHGNAVLTTSEIEQAIKHNSESSSSDDSPLPEADGLVTQQSQQAVWVASADCTPVLIADSKTGQVAAVHAGWRGTAAKIVPCALARLQAQGSQIQNLRIALGPAIAGSVYQVSTQVAVEVGCSIIPGEPNEAILQSLYSLPNSPVSADPQPGRVRLDIRRVIALQLEQLGVSHEQVAIAPYCTYQEPLFFSYRRDNLRKIQWSGIVSISPCSNGST